MEIVYLGLLSSVFNWVYNQILSPIISFISGILETVLEWLFNSVLEPLLEAVFWPLFYAVLDIIMETLGILFYTVLASMFEIIDAMQTGFEIFSGVGDVTMGSTTGSLLEVLFMTNSVQQALLAMVLIGITLAIFFAILSTIRSMGDLGEQKMPVSKVMKLAMKSVGYMVMIPAVSYFVIVVSTTVLRQVDAAFGGEDSTLSSAIFVVASLDAANDATYNISGVSAKDDSTGTARSDIGIFDAVRNPYYSCKSEYDYTSYSDVQKNFTLSGFDYFIGYVCCIAIAVILALSLLNFILRIFDVILLVLIAPLFAALIPLDDGEKFKGWQELFVGKLMSGYGAIMAMQLYLLLAPGVMSGSLSFGSSSTEANYLLRMIFMIGSAWAVVKAGPMVTQLFSFQASMGEQSAMEATKSFANSAHDMYKAHKAGKENENAQEDGQKFGGEKAQKPLSSNDKARQKLTSSFSDTGKGKEMQKANIFQGADGKKHMGVNLSKGFRRGEMADGTRVTRFMGIGVNTKIGADGKRHIDKVRLPFMSWKKDENGKMRVSKANIGVGSLRRAETVTKNPDGTTTRTMGSMGVNSLLGIKRDKRQADGSVRAEDVQERSFLGIAKWKPDSNGELHCTKLNLGFMKMKRQEVTSTGADGKQTKGFSDMYVSNIKPLGIHRNRDAATGETYINRIGSANVDFRTSSGPAKAPEPAVTPASGVVLRPPEPPSDHT